MSPSRPAARSTTRPSRNAAKGAATPKPGAKAGKPAQRAPGRPKDLEKQAAILDAAKRLFPLHGYEGVSMEAIAAEAGVSKLTVYNHFTDKENLFTEAVRCRCEELLPHAVFEAEAGPDRVADGLREIGHHFLALISSDEAIQLHRTLAARAMTDRDADINGICLRGKAGWGENMAFITALANSYGARWFDENWQPQFDSPEWKAALQFYIDLMKDAGPAGASSNGFNENLTLFQQGKCGMWMDATVAAGFVSDANNSTVADKVGFALFPDAGTGNHGNWLWVWSLAIPASSDAKEAAKTFVQWATSKDYAALVGEKEGWALAPPGTRTSLYDNPDYKAVAAFAEPTLAAINAADTSHPSVQPVPYTGGQFVSIPEFQNIGTQVGQLFAAVVAGQSTVDDALAQAQSVVTREMTRAGYIK